MTAAHAHTSICAFVAGATGYAGRHVVRALIASGVRVVAHVRPDGPKSAIWHRRLTDMGAEVALVSWQPEAIGRALAKAKPNLVFALLGTTKQRARREGLKDPYRTVDIGLSTCLIDAAQALEPKPRLVYLSSAGADAPRGAYLAARHEVEAYLRQSGLACTIARPGLFTGARDEERTAEKALARLMPPVAGVLRVLGASHLAAKMTPMTGPSLGQALVEHALHAKRHTEVLEAIDLQASRT